MYDNIAASTVVVTAPTDVPRFDATLRFAEDDVALTLNLGRDDPSPAGDRAAQTSMNLATATLSTAFGHSTSGVSSLTINSAGVPETDASVELAGVTGITALSADGTAGLHTLLVGQAPA